MATIYHMIPRGDLPADGDVRPDSLAAEGFVHCSYRRQVTMVADFVFAGRGDLLLLELDRTRIASRIVDEPATGTDEMFPHIVGPIPRDAICRVHELRLGADGRFVLPASLAAEPDPAVPQTLLDAYDWYDHPEGPKFVETHRDEHRTCGHWLFPAGVFSGFHQVLNNEELWLIHSGRMLVHVISPSGELETLRLGHDVAHGDRPAAAVPVGHWQAAELPEGEPYAFGSNVCAPAFSFDEFRMADRDALTGEFPQHADLIRRLTYEHG